MIAHTTLFFLFAVPLGTIIVRIWGAEPARRPCVKTPLVNQWLSDVGSWEGYSDGGRTGEALRRLLQWRRQHLGLNY